LKMRVGWRTTGMMFFDVCERIVKISNTWCFVTLLAA